MKQIFQAVVILVILAVAGPVLALGVGKLEKRSGFNERLDARIPVLSATADELNTLRVGLADRVTFRRAEMDRAPVLDHLQFKLVEPQNGRDYVHITSSEPIREPFLNFLLELRWASGRLFREYTVLLDPPLYDPGQRVAASPTAPSRRSEPLPQTAPKTAQAESKYSHQVIYPDQQAAGGRSQPTFNGSGYLVQSGETLWQVATAMRPDSSVTHEQMMLALLRANPEAFINNNINLVKAGAVLQMPSRDQMQALAQAEAVAEVRQQHNLWEQARQSLAAAPTERPETISAPASTGSSTAETGDTDAAAVADESRLRLVANEQGTANQEGGTAGGSDTELQQKLSLALENLESVRQENTELRERLTENEALIKDLERLIELKDNELAALQGRTAQEAADVAPEQEVAASAPGQQPVFRQFEHAVVYPHGEPANMTDDFAGAGVAQAGGSEPAFRQFEHEVNYPDDSPAATMPMPPAADTADTAMEPEYRRFEHEVFYPEEAAPVDEQVAAADTASSEAGGTEEAAVDETAAPETATDETVSSALMDSLGAYAAAARNFILNNVVLVAGVLVALLLLFLGGRLMSQRRSEAEDESEVAGTDFPDFATTPAAVPIETDETEAATPVAASADDTEAELGDETLTGVFPPMGGMGAGTAAAKEEKEDEEYPLAEVNVLMAYEHYDQAEDLVRQAIEQEPGNVEYHAKLLEVFYAANNRKKYEAAARELHNLTRGEGEPWAMAVAMWQEISPNRALFEAGADEEEDTGEPAGGIVDITGQPDTADASEKALDLNLDSTAPAAEGGESHLLELTTGDDSVDSEMIDITGEGQASDGDILDLTEENQAADTGEFLELTEEIESADNEFVDLTGTGEASSLEDTEEVKRSSQPVEQDESEALDFSLGDIASEHTDLLDLSNEGGVLEDEATDLLDVTGPGGKAREAEEESDRNDLEEDATFANIIPDRDSVATTDLDLQLDQDRENDLNDDDALDEISAQLDRLEQTLGTLSRHESHTVGRGTTSDALDGIDQALEELNEKTGDDIQQQGTPPEDAGLEIDLEQSGDGLDLDDDDLEFEMGDETYNLDVSADSEDEPLEFELDEDSDEASSALSDDSDELLDDLEIDAESDSQDVQADDEVSEEEEPVPGTGDVLDDAMAADEELEPDAGEDGAGDNARSQGEDDLALDTIKMDAVKLDPVDHGFELQVDEKKEDTLESIDMDTTVELPKNKPDEDALTFNYSDAKEEREEDSEPLDVPRSDGRSLEDELTTKLDLAKAYAELGDSDSARSILEDVMRGGSETQKREADELLQQLS